MYNPGPVGVYIYLTRRWSIGLIYNMLSFKGGLLYHKEKCGDYRPDGLRNMNNYYRIFCIVLVKRKLYN